MHRERKIRRGRRQWAAATKRPPARFIIGRSVPAAATVSIANHNFRFRLAGIRVASVASHSPSTVGKSGHVYWQCAARATCSAEFATAAANLKQQRLLAGRHTQATQGAPSTAAARSRRQQHLAHIEQQQRCSCSSPASCWKPRAAHTPIAACRPLEVVYAGGIAAHGSHSSEKDGSGCSRHLDTPPLFSGPADLQGDSERMDGFKKMLCPK